MPKGTPTNRVPMIERLRQVVLQLLEEHKRDGALPINSRFLFYELEQRGLVVKVKPKGSALGNHEPTPGPSCIDESAPGDKLTGLGLDPDLDLYESRHP